MKYTDLVSHNHIKGNWEYHLEWTPKYRFNSLGKESIKQDCEAILLESASLKGLQVKELAVMPDHVHIIVESDNPQSPSEILRYLKGRSSYYLFRKHPNFRKRYWGGHFWSRGNFCRTIGIDRHITREYVRKQSDINQRKLSDYTETHGFSRG